MPATRGKRALPARVDGVEISTKQTLIDNNISLFRKIFNMEKNLSAFRLNLVWTAPGKTLSAIK